MLATDLKTGTIYQEEGQPLLVEKYQHVKTARGGATVRVKTRNLITDSVRERSYQSSANVEDAAVIRKNSQYLYKEGANYIFMDPEDYTQVYISADRVGDKGRYLKEGESAQVMFFEGNAVSIELPNTMVFEVTYTEPGFKGNTVTNVYKDAELENGLRVKVPTFIDIGEKIKVNTKSGEYVSKA